MMSLAISTQCTGVTDVRTDTGRQLVPRLRTAWRSKKRAHSQLSEGPLIRGLVLGLGLGSSKVIQTAKKLTSPKMFREVLA